MGIERLVSGKILVPLALAAGMSCYEHKGPQDVKTPDGTPADTIVVKKAMDFYEQKYGKRVVPDSAYIDKSLPTMHRYLILFIDPEDPSKKTYISASNPPANHHDSVFEATGINKRY